MKTLIKGARILDGDPADIILDGGVVAEVGAGLSARGATTVDADGLVALPGLVDLHTHLREPGREDAETVETGSRAAALGGYTAVCAMANTDPVADTAGVVEQVYRLGQAAGLVDVQPIGAVSIGLRGEQMAELGAMATSAATVRIFSDDGHCVSDPRLMRRALEYVKAFDGVIAQHAQDPRLTEGAQLNEGEMSARLGLAGWPAVAEEAIIARDCLLAAHVGSALHVCHVSTAGSAEIIRWAKSKGWPVTAEVTPHHLLLTDELAAGYDPVFKVNPPLRTEADVAELGAMATSAATVRIFSDDGHCVSDPRLMRRALEYVKAFDGVIAQHAEEPRLTLEAQMHEAEESARLGLTGWPAVAEEAIIARDALLAGHVGSRLHICHVSTAGSVEILRWAKSKGWRVTAEVTPHHLLLTDTHVGCGHDGRPGSYDPVFKVNPPLRTSDDVAALREALVDGTIDIVATDHAPHTVEDKECEWAYARPGMLGLETALSVVRHAVGDALSWDDLAERMSRRPARIAGLDDHGHDPAPGVPANLTLVDPAARWTVDPTELASRSRNTPYEGLTLPGRVVATFLRGEPTVLDGKAVR